jgi:hypothetical protein
MERNREESLKNLEVQRLERSQCRGRAATSASSSMRRDLATLLAGAVVLVLLLFLVPVPVHHLDAGAAAAQRAQAWRVARQIVRKNWLVFSRRLLRRGGRRQRGGSPEVAFARAGAEPTKAPGMKAAAEPARATRITRRCIFLLQVGYDSKWLMCTGCFDESFQNFDLRGEG